MPGSHAKFPLVRDRILLYIESNFVALRHVRIPDQKGPALRHFGTFKAMTEDAMRGVVHAFCERLQTFGTGICGPGKTEQKDRNDRLHAFILARCLLHQRGFTEAASPRERLAKQFGTPVRQQTGNLRTASFKAVPALPLVPRQSFGGRFVSPMPAPGHRSVDVLRTRRDSLAIRSRSRQRDALHLPLTPTRRLAEKSLHIAAFCPRSSVDRAAVS